MKIVRVVYTTKPEYSEKNQANIKTVMSDLRKMGSPGINYHVCLGANGNTFVHTAFFESDSDERQLNELPAFRQFQTELKASGPNEPPKVEIVTLVGSSKDIF